MILKTKVLQEYLYQTKIHAPESAEKTIQSRSVSRKKKTGYKGEKMSYTHLQWKKFPRPFLCVKGLKKLHLYQINPRHLTIKYPGSGSQLWKRRECSSYLAGVVKVVLAPLTVFSLKRSTEGACAVLLNVLHQQMATDNVLCKNWYLLGEKKFQTTHTK